jgi:7-cyano-7-deazaguanine reductase
MKHNPLGKDTEYKARYDASLLFPIPRSGSREAEGIRFGEIAGYDVWNAYEFSWLNESGKPIVKRLRIVYPAQSLNIVESKSLKLYLGGFIMTRFSSDDEVAAVIRRDLEEILGSPLMALELFDHTQPPDYSVSPVAELIDQLDVSCSVYEFDAGLLRSAPSPIHERLLMSHLLKSNCPITNQPDWATMEIRYRGGRELDAASLLRYVVSFRNHGGYHESCCERIFMDLLNELAPELLVVKCFFTRRGGIDINPCRFHGVAPDAAYSMRFWRQ